MIWLKLAKIIILYSFIYITLTKLENINFILIFSQTKFIIFLMLNIKLLYFNLFIVKKS